MAYNEIDEALLAGSAYIDRCTVDTATAYHSHNFVEIAYVSDGSGTHIINGRSYHIQKGNITLINYDIPHKFEAADNPLIIYNCIFTPAYFDLVLAGSRNFFDVSNHFLLGNFYSNDFQSFIDVQADSGENAHIQNIFQRMLLEYESKQLGYKEIIRGYLIELLILIFRLQMHSRPDHSDKLLNAIDYINGHYTQEIRIGELAALSNASISSFCRKFKALTGTTVIHYIQELRMEEACRLLNSTDKNVTTIANDVGYSDIKHFYNVFRKITHRLPKDFRKCNDLIFDLSHP